MERKKEEMYCVCVWLCVCVCVCVHRAELLIVVEQSSARSICWDVCLLSSSSMHACMYAVVVNGTHVNCWSVFAETLVLGSELSDPRNYVRTAFFRHEFFIWRRQLVII